MQFVSRRLTRLSSGDILLNREPRKGAFLAILVVDADGTVIVFNSHEAKSHLLHDKATFYAKSWVLLSTWRQAC